MAGFARMDKHGGCASGRQGGCDFGPDVSALAHARDNDAALDIQHHVNGVRKARVQSGFEADQGLSFNVQSLARELKGLIGIEGHVFILTRDGPKRDYDEVVSANTYRSEFNAA
jgi:hypothetical protein